MQSLWETQENIVFKLAIVHRIEKADKFIHCLETYISIIIIFTYISVFRETKIKGIYHENLNSEK